MCTPGDRELAQAVGPRHDLLVSEDQLLEARVLAQAVGLRRDLIGAPCRFAEVTA
jgi:hypothetical protein